MLTLDKHLKESLTRHNLDQNQLKTLSDAYCGGYIKGRAEFKHRIRIGLLLGIVGAITAFTFNSSIDKRRRLQDVDKEYGELHAEYQSFRHQVAMISDQINVFTVYDKEFVQDVRKHLGTISILKAKIDSLRQQVNNIATPKDNEGLFQFFPTKKSTQLNIGCRSLQLDLNNYELLLSSYLLIAIKDYDRALKNLRNYIVNDYNATSFSSIQKSNDFSAIIQDLINRKTVHALKLSIPLISFIYLLVPENDPIYSIFTGKIESISNYDLITKLGDIFNFKDMFMKDGTAIEEFDNLLNDNDIPDYVHALYHNVAYAYLIKAERLLNTTENEKNDSKELQFNLDLATKSLELSLEVWSKNPQFMPYYSYCKSKTIAGTVNEFPYCETFSKLLVGKNIDLQDEKNNVTYNRT